MSKQLPKSRSQDRITRKRPTQVVAEELPPEQAKPGEQIPALPPGTSITTLDSGLTVIVREDSSAPVVSAQMWCKTGSIDEGKWLGAGLSHVLEHMLFKGTTNRPGSRIDQEVQEAGGSMNAYTSFDRTVYYVNVPDTGARVAIDILCDLVQNASLPEEELEKELDVIRREMDMNQDDPARKASRRLFEVAYTRSPYRFTVIGYPDIFNELKSADIRAYYRERYAPNNLFMVVAGNVTHKAVVDQVREAFSGSKARAFEAVSLLQEPKQTAPRESIEEAAIELAHSHFCWHIPDLRHPDMPALDLLAALLGGGRSSRLYREVREKKGLVTSVDAWVYCPGDPGLLGMSAVGEANKLQEARSAMLAEIDRLKTELVSERELAKVINQFTASIYATRKTMEGQARDLGSNWISAGDLNFSERYLAQARRLTPKDIRRVACEYLTFENQTFYALMPTGSAPKPKVASSSVGENAIQKIVLPNGLCLLIKEDHRLPFVEIRSAFKGGVLAETEQTSGLTQLAVKMLLQGTRTRSAEQIAAEIEFGGGSIDVFGGNNSFGVSVEVLSNQFESGFDLFTDVLLNPAFPEDAFERERRIQLEVIRANRDHLLQSCSQKMRQALFGLRGYGMDAIGSEESLERLKLDNLSAFHRKMVVPNNCVLSVFGDVTAESVTKLVTSKLSAWRAKPLDLGLLPGPASPGTVKRISEHRDKKQAVLVLGFPGASLRDEDRFALELLQESCSDLGSRLFLRIREQLGLAYYVGAQNFVGLAPGYFAFYTGTAPEKTAEVEKQFFKEIELLRSEGLSAEELKRAKAKLIGQRKISRQDLGSNALTVALNELYGLGYQYGDYEDSRLEAVTLDEVKAVARKYLTPNSLVLATVAPLE